MTTFDPEALLADARRRHQAALERVNRTCARKGVRIATQRRRAFLLRWPRSAWLALRRRRRP
jgi:hypothetical protein